MTDQQFTNICSEMRHDIKGMTPWDTGNLADKATKISDLVGNEIRIYVDENIAPYFPYVNNRPTYQVKGKFGKSYTKQNKNYGYFQHAVEVAIEKLARKIDGEIIK